MARYVLKYNELVTLEATQRTLELEQLEKWLHTTGIDPDFNQEHHVYTNSDTGDDWIMLPELSSGELFAMSLIVSSRELYHDNNPVRFTRPPLDNDVQ